MKKTYFQKFIPDKYNFYKAQTHNTINLESTSILKKSRSRVYDTLETHPAEVRKESLPLVKPEDRTIALHEIQSHRSRDRSRERLDRSRERLDRSRERIWSIGIGKRERLRTVVFQKNMDSLS